MKVILQNASLEFITKSYTPATKTVNGSNISEEVGAELFSSAFLSHSSGYKYNAEGNNYKSVCFVQIPDRTSKITIIRASSANIYGVCTCLLLKEGYELSGNFDYGYLNSAYIAGEKSKTSEGDDVETGATYNSVTNGYELTDISSDAKYICITTGSSSEWAITFDYEV